MAIDLDLPEGKEQEPPQAGLISIVDALPITSSKLLEVMLSLSIAIDADIVTQRQDCWRHLVILSSSPSSSLLVDEC
jgi:hypothetical protein